MKKAILVLLLFSFAFIGCSQKEPTIVFKDKLVCIEQQKLDKKEPIQIRVHNDDLIVAKEYKEDIDKSLQFYEKQVDRNNNFCKQLTEYK